MSGRTSKTNRAKRRSGRRGATLTEYAMVLSILTTATIGGIEALTQESGDFLVETGNQIGERRYVRDEIASITIPDPPAWLTTTTAAPTTTTSTTAPTSAPTSSSTPPSSAPATTVRPAMANLAVNGSAEASSTGWGTSADWAIDGDTDGDFYENSVTHSARGSDSNGQREWLSLDLGQDDNLIDNIEIWNRTDCCGSRLRDVYIVISDNPIIGATLAEAETSAGMTSLYLGSDPLGESTVQPINRTGRYIRVFGADDQYFHVAEIVVNGQGPGQ